MTPDQGYQWESDKLTVIHHKREPRGQPFPRGDHKAQMSRRVERHNKHKVSKGAKIRNRYNQVPHKTEKT